MYKNEWLGKLVGRYSNTPTVVKESQPTHNFMLYTNLCNVYLGCCHMHFLILNFMNQVMHALLPSVPGMTSSSVFLTLTIRNSHSRPCHQLNVGGI